MRRQKNAPVTPARDRGAVLLSERESTRTLRVVVPQLSELASGIPSAQLQLLRGEVQPGERVAVYQKGKEVRVLITGPDRRYTLPPRQIGEQSHCWRRIGVVEITDDGERALPELVS